MTKLHWSAVALRLKPGAAFAVKGRYLLNRGQHDVHLLAGPLGAVQTALMERFEAPREELQGATIQLALGTPWSGVVSSGTVLQMEDWCVAITSCDPSDLFIEEWTGTQPAEFPPARPMQQERRAIPGPSRNGLSLHRE